MMRWRTPFFISDSRSARLSVSAVSPSVCQRGSWTLRARYGANHSRASDRTGEKCHLQRRFRGLRFEGGSASSILSCTWLPRQAACLLSMSQVLDGFCRQPQDQCVSRQKKVASAPVVSKAIFQNACTSIRPPTHHPSLGFLNSQSLDESPEWAAPTVSLSSSSVRALRIVKGSVSKPFLASIFALLASSSSPYFSASWTSDQLGPVTKRPFSFVMVIWPNLPVYLS